MRSKKGVSILIFGLISFFVMTVLAVSVMQTVQKLEFKEYAGIDAQTLSNAKYTSYKQEYFMDEMLFSFVQEQFVFSDFLNYYLYKSPSPLPNTVVVEDVINGVPTQYYAQIESHIGGFLSEEFSSFYVAKANLYNDYVVKNNSVIVNSNFANNEFNLYYDGTYLRAIASKPMSVKQINSANSEVEYVFYPHGRINSAQFSSLKDTLLLPRHIKHTFSSCIIAENDITPYTTCIQRLFDTHSELQNAQIVAQEINNITSLNVDLGSYDLFYEFKTP